MSMTGNIASATIAGASSFVVAQLGMEPGAIFWAVIGSILGVMYAPPTTRLYAALLFISATMTCAMCATWMAGHWFDNSVHARSISAVMLGSSFHPILKAWISSVPELVTWAVLRIKTFLNGGTTK